MTDGTSPHINYPIDVVITWVDGNHPDYRRKMEPFIDSASQGMNPGAHSTRFASVNEIRYCVLSIMRFAPFVRNIFIVTDGQDPNLNDDIKTHFPERAGSLRIIDHSEIFRGYTDFLPTFNSRSIENMVWRIEDLADNFVCFNDDTFLVREISPEEWFIGYRPVLRGKWMAAPVLRIAWNAVRKAVNRFLLNNHDFLPRPSFHLGQWEAAKAAGYRTRYFVFSHTPHTVSRTMACEFFNRNQTLMKRNISHRFRSIKQFNSLSLLYHLELKTGNRNIARPALAYLQPFNRPHDYIDKKLSLCETDQSIRYICIQSLEMCSKDDQEKIFSWMEKILKL
ncbi:MAG: Stealth CR1 domain-containing protein [Bacteroidales bacterium]